MKKTLLLFCSAVLALSANADIMPKKLSAQMLPVQKQALSPVTVAMKKMAPMATASTVTEITATSYSSAWTYYEGSNDWFGSVTSPDGHYIIRLDFYSETLHGTYTLADLDDYYSYIEKYDDEGQQTILKFTEASVTLSPGAAENLTDLDATLVCDNGETVHVSVIEEPYIPKTYHVEASEFNELTYYPSYNEWYIIFEQDKYLISLDYTGTEVFAGTFTTDDIIAKYTYARDQEAGINTLFETITFTCTGEDPSVACDIVGEGVLANGDQVSFHAYKKAPIQPTEIITVNAVCQSLDFNKEEGCSILTARDEVSGWSYQLGWKGKVGKDLTLVKDYSFYITADGEKCMADNGKVTVTVDASNTAHIQAEMVCEDAKGYQFDLTNALAVVGQEQVTISNAKIEDFFGFLFYMSGSNDEYSLVEAEFASEITAGDYTDAYGYSIYMKRRGATPEDEETYVSPFIIKSAIVTIDENGHPVLDCSFLGLDMIDYNVHMYYKVEEAEGEVTIPTFEGLAFDNFFSLGGMQLYGYSADGTMYLSVAANTDHVAGTYTSIDGSLLNEYTYIAWVSAEDPTKATKIATCVDGEFTFEMDEAGHITATGKFLADDNYLYNVSLTSEFELEHISNDKQDADVDVTFGTEDLVSLNNYIEEDEYAYIRLENAERGDIFAMTILLDQEDAEIVIPEGTYEINDSYAAPSVQPGEISGGKVYPTYYALSTADGKLDAENIWFLRTGTVTITKVDGLLSFEVNAKNSYGRTVHVAYNVSVVAIEQLMAKQAGKAGKHLRQGTLTITDAEGKLYSGQGQMIH